MNRETFESEFLGVHERGDKHDSFSDEFRGVEDAGARDSFSSEFRGVPARSFGDERPSGTFDHGRKVRRTIAAIVVGLAVLGGGAWAIWYWSEPIGAWLAGLQGSDTPSEPAPVEPEPAPEPAPEPPPVVEPPSDKVFGIKGAPEGGDSGPVPDPMPVDEPSTTDTSADTPQPPQPPTPPTAGTGFETLTTQVRGKVSSAAIGSRLAAVDAALKTCVAQSSGLGSVELELRFTIKWNGKAHAVTVTGGDEALQRCVKTALPTGGWPQPSDGGEASITRRWKLGANG